MTIKQAIDHWFHALKNQLRPEIEIADLPTLSHYVGQWLNIYAPRAGRNGRTFRAKLDSCSKTEATFDINGKLVDIDEKVFKAGMRCYPIRGQNDF